MFSKLKQYNDLRKQANQLKSKLSEETVTVENDALTIVIDGNQDIKSVIVNSAYLTPERKNKLESEIQDGFAKALKKIQRVMAEKVREMGGFNLPGMGGSK